MFLHRIHLDPRCREVRRDLSDPYQLHSTLCRAFSTPDRKCPEGVFLWRFEPETDPSGYPRVLVQSAAAPHWDGIGVEGWLMKADPAVDLVLRLRLDQLQPGCSFRFRLRANPCVTRNGRRLGLLRRNDQEAWIRRKGQEHGFALPGRESFGRSDAPGEGVDVRVSQEHLLRGKRHDGNTISIYSVLYDGILAVTGPEAFRQALRTGIGHGKSMGLGLLSVAPLG